MSLKIKNIIVSNNGHVAFFDKEGEQIPELQGSIVDYNYLHKVAKLIVKSEVSPTIAFGDIYDWRKELGKLVTFYQQRKG
jgi:hypothetical protein